MNLRLVLRLIGIVSWLIGGTMIFSLPWAWPAFGVADQFEYQGLIALLVSIAICFVWGFILRYMGRNTGGVLYRKEAMAVVALSWVMATLLGALPFRISGTAIEEDERTGKPVAMTMIDCLFESQSGFSTTGATVLENVESKSLVPRCILFWRSSTHFLGGLGIIVLFVAILGQGSAGKALMRTEMPGPSKEGSQTRMQHAAWTFAGIYCLLTVILAVILKIETMTWFDAFCTSFGTMATGGFSTKNTSIAYYDSISIEMTVLVFMVLAGTNFTLLYFLLLGKPRRLLADAEWRTYITIMAGVTVLVIFLGTWYGDFESKNMAAWWQKFLDALRYGSFQVVSIMTTTGFSTHDFDTWSSFGRGVLFLLMFIGGCAGSTGGGLKVIRHILFTKVLRQNVEHSFHPTVVRPLQLGGQTVEDSGLRYNILAYFGLILFIFVMSWIFLVAVEPDSTWTEEQQPLQNKLIDAASSVSATINNIGPGLGVVGATENYANFSPCAKILFILLMMIGRLEIFVILVIFLPSFWRAR